MFRHRYFCIWTHVVQADICLHPCECSHLERHCIHTYTHKYTYIKNHITDTLVYQPVLCTLTLVCALASAHTENLFVYMHGLTRLHKSHHRFICIWAHVVRTHICLCPCPCSHLEPLCIHTYVTSIPSQICLYINPCCAISRLYVPLRVLTLRTSLYTYIDKYYYTYFVSWLVLYMNPCCANSHMFVPLRALTLRASLHTHTHAHKYTYIISQIVLYMNPCCANSHMSVPLRVLTLRTFLHIFTSIQQTVS